MEEEKNLLQPENSTPEEKGDDGEKRFSQADLDRIIRERLARVKVENQDTTKIEAREKELTARENKLKCREYLVERGYPVEFLEVIDTNDADMFMEKADKMQGMFSRQHEDLAPLASTEDISENSVGNAFAPGGAKHIPRIFPPCYEE